MAIEEKKVPLEFTFTPSNIDGLAEVMNYDITYEPDMLKRDNFLKYELTISNNGVALHCPIELLTEVVDFLTEKGVIEPKIPIGPLPRIATGTPAPAQTNIPLPVIDGVDENVVGLNDGTPAPSVTAFTSFDNNQVNVEEIVSNINVDNVPVATPTAAPIIKVGNDEVVSDEIKARPVIKTRAGDTDSEEDILRAEREAAEMRGTKESTFRRSD